MAENAQTHVDKVLNDKIWNSRPNNTFIINTGYKTTCESIAKKMMDINPGLSARCDNADLYITIDETTWEKNKPYYKYDGTYWNSRYWTFRDGSGSTTNCFGGKWPTCF